MTRPQQFNHGRDCTRWGLSSSDRELIPKGIMVDKAATIRMPIEFICSLPEPCTMCVVARVHLEFALAECWSTISKATMLVIPKINATAITANRDRTGLKIESVGFGHDYIMVCGRCAHVPVAYF